MDARARDDGGENPLEELEPAHLAAFSAFRRKASAADSAVGDEPTAKDILPPMSSVRLARRVFAGPEGTVDLVPGPGSICCVCIVAGSGETTIGDTAIANAALDGTGHVGSAGDSAATFAGVLPAGAHDLRIIDRTGRSIPILLTDDDGYWTTVAEPIDMRWTAGDGSEHQSVFGRYEMHRVINPPTD